MMAPETRVLSLAASGIMTTRLLGERSRTKEKVQGAPKADQCEVGEPNGQSILAIKRGEKIAQQADQQWAQPQADEVEAQHLYCRGNSTHIDWRQGLYHGDGRANNVITGQAGDNKKQYSGREIVG